MHVMLDLETWGKAPGCAIRSVGAVFFDPRTGILSHTFYANVDSRYDAEFGLARDPETEAWWQDQSAAAQVAFTTPEPKPIDEVCASFREWFCINHGRYVWGHGASFDPLIMEHAMKVCSVEVPWNFWDVRCCRTVLSLGRRRPDRYRTGTHHNALDDAKAQAQAVAAVFRHKTFEPE